MFQFKQTKYKSKKTSVDGLKFDSQAEADFYVHLKTLQQCGHTKILEVQPKVYMTAARILYKPDFKIEEQGAVVYIDVKGMKTAVFNLKVRLWEHYGLGTLRLVSKNRFGFFTAKEYTTRTRGTHERI